MHVELAREQAADLLLGRDRFDTILEGVPPYLRARVARRAAVRCLGEQTRPTSLELGALIHAATRDSDGQVRAAAVEVLARLLPPGLSAPLLLACSADHDDRVREAAQSALAKLPSEEAQLVSLPRPAAPARPLKMPGFSGH